MPKLSLRASALVAVGLVLTAGSALAQANNLTREYLVTAKPGMVAQLEDAIRAHAQWRKANHDPWTWAVYTPETGAAYGTFIIRSGDHSWADFDAYDKGFGPQGVTPWNANVMPLVESMSSEIDMTLADSLNQLPPTGTAISLVNVTAFHLRPGMEPQFVRLAAQAVKVLKAAKYPGYWVWEVPVSGGPEPGPVIYLGGLNENWASMQEPNPSFAEVMTKALGQDGFAKWTASLDETLRGSSQDMYRFRPDLSVLPN
jgi:hypothetical protein